MNDAMKYNDAPGRLYPSDSCASSMTF